MVILRYVFCFLSGKFPNLTFASFKFKHHQSCHASSLYSLTRSLVKVDVQWNFRQKWNVLDKWHNLYHVGYIKNDFKRWFYSFRGSWCQYIFEAKARLQFQQSVHSVLLNSVENFNLFVSRLLLQFCIIKCRLKWQCISVITSRLRHGPSCSRIVSQSV